MHIDHVGVLVADIDESKAVFEHLGLAIDTVEYVPEFGVEIAFINVGESMVELVEPVDEESELAADLAAEKRGACLHHIAFHVADIDARLAALRDAGVQLADERPRQGAGGARVAFLERRAAAGVRVELVERSGSV